MEEMIIISGWYHLNFDHLEGGCMWLPNFDYNIRVEWRRRRRSWIAPNYSDYKENSRCSFHVPDLWPSNVILINGRSDRPFSLVLRKICYYYLRHHHHLQCSSRTRRRERRMSTENFLNLHPCNFALLTCPSVSSPVILFPFLPSRRLIY